LNYVQYIAAVSAVLKYDCNFLVQGKNGFRFSFVLTCLL